MPAHDPVRSKPVRPLERLDSSVGPRPEDSVNSQTRTTGFQQVLDRPNIQARGALRKVGQFQSAGLLADCVTTEAAFAFPAVIPTAAPASNNVSRLT